MAKMVKHDRHRQASEIIHRCVKRRDITKNLQMPSLVGGASGQPREAVDAGIAAEQHIDPAPHRTLSPVICKKVGRSVVIDDDDGPHRRVGGTGFKRCPVVGSIDAWLDDHRPADAERLVKMSEGGKRCRRGRVASLGDLWRWPVKDMEMAVAGTCRHIKAGRQRIGIRRGAKLWLDAHA